VSFDSEVRKREVPHNYANFGIGTLVPLLSPLPPMTVGILRAPGVGHRAHIRIRR
jgi:hypothetical protein